MLGTWQIVIIAVLVILLFGRGKIAGLMGEVAKGITSFRKGMREGADDQEQSKSVADHSQDPKAGITVDTEAKEKDKVE